VLASPLIAITCAVALSIYLVCPPFLAAHAVSLPPGRLGPPAVPTPPNAPFIAVPSSTSCYSRWVLAPSLEWRLSFSFGQRTEGARVETESGTAMKKLRIVTVGISGGGSLTRQSRTPADSPPQDCSPYRGLHVRRWGLGLVHHAMHFCAVPNPTATIRDCFIAAGTCPRSAGGEQQSVATAQAARGRLRQSATVSAAGGWGATRYLRGERHAGGHGGVGEELGGDLRGAGEREHFLRQPRGEPRRTRADNRHGHVQRALHHQQEERELEGASVRRRVLVDPLLAPEEWSSQFVPTGEVSPWWHLELGRVQKRNGAVSLYRQRVRWMDEDHPAQAPAQPAAAPNFGTATPKACF
jgi:hypothetical protein